MSDVSYSTRSNVNPVGPVAALNPLTSTPHRMIESIMQELNDWGHGNGFGVDVFDETMNRKLW